MLQQKKYGNPRHTPKLTATDLDAVIRMAGQLTFFYFINTVQESSNPIILLFPEGFPTWSLEPWHATTSVLEVTMRQGDRSKLVARISVLVYKRVWWMRGQVSAFNCCDLVKKNVIKSIVKDTTFTHITTETAFHLILAIVGGEIVPTLALMYIHSFCSSMPKCGSYSFLVSGFTF